MPTIDLPNIFVILLNYKGVADTIACLQSLQKISYPNYSIVIVDNASPDDSVEVIRKYLQSEYHNEYTIFDSLDEAMLSQSHQTKYTLLQTGHNGGYGHGNNIGIKYALKNGADYMLVLNNDTLVAPSFLEPMVQMCEEDSSIGIASGKIYYYDQPDIIWFNGGSLQPYTAKVQHVNFNEKDTGQKPPEENTFISGCMWLIPKRVFETVGFINEEYFMYVEDLEYCQRVLSKGYSLKLCEQSKIWHKVGNSSGRWSPFFAYWMSRNKMQFIEKNLKGICKITATIYHTLYTPFWWIFHKRPDLFLAHLRGILRVNEVRK